MKKRVLSFVLALVLALSLTPAALAYDRQASRADRISVTEAQPPAPPEFSSSVNSWEEQVPFEGPASTPGEEYLSGAEISEEEVYQILNGLRSKYPEGMYWTNESNTYILSVLCYDEGDGKDYRMHGAGPDEPDDLRGQAHAPDE